MDAEHVEAPDSFCCARIGVGGGRAGALCPGPSPLVHFGGGGRRYPSGGGGRPSKKLGGMVSANSSSVRPKYTLSQSPATTSFLSASTRSTPLPHTTTSLAAGLLLTANTSSPGLPT